MWILLLCILVNASLSVIFKLFNKYGINNLQAITTNYFVCVIVAAVVYGSWPIPSRIWEVPWFPYAVFLGILFIAGFNFVAKTVQVFGIVVSTIFQKMSLLAPTIVAIIYFGEPNNFLKTTGIIAALVAIIVMSYNPRKTHVAGVPVKLWILPFAVFLTSCVIEVTLLTVDRMNIANNADIGFIASLFMFAGIGGLLLIIIRSFRSGYSFRWKNVAGGIALGIPNFFSIYLLLLLLSRGWGGSVVFPINNVGILAVSAVFGFIIFKERLTPLKLFGFILSVIAIICIANA